MMRVLHITTIDSTSYILLMPLLKSLQSRGYAVEVACFMRDWQASIEREGIRTHPISAFNRKIDPLSDVKAIFQIVTLLRREKFDIVHTHTPKPNFYARIVGRLLGVPVIIGTEHGFYFYNMRGLSRKLYKSMSWFGSLFSDATIVINKEDSDLALRENIISSQKIFPLFCGLGVDTNRFNDSISGNIVRMEFRLPQDALVIGFVGRLTKEKGCLDLIRAAEKVIHAIPESYFLLVGPSEDGIDKTLKHFIESKEMTPKIVFTGSRSDIPEILASFDIFVLPSYREGLGMVLLEAAASGVPAVAYDIRGCRDVIADGVTGRLVSPKDVDGLADAIIDLANDSSKRRRMGHASRSLAVEKFEAGKSHQQVEALYRRLLAKKKVLSSVT